MTSDLSQEPRALLRVALLGLVIDVRDAESRGVSVGPDDYEQVNPLIR